MKLGQYSLTLSNRKRIWLGLAVALGFITFSAVTANTLSTLPKDSFFVRETKRQPVSYSNQFSDSLQLQTGIKTASPIFVDEAHQLDLVFSQEDYALSTTPRLAITAIPKGFNTINDVEEKKRLFLKAVLPLILLVNEELSKQHDRLADYAKIAEKDMSFRQYLWAKEMFDTYRVPFGEWERLLRRVNGVPVAIALAQAAIESGWGSSRFAVEGNALFGQWVWGNDALGIVPELRDAGETYSVRKFDSPYHAVKAYIHNLNTHSAYKAFREARVEKADLNVLLQGLSVYSEERQTYVNLLQSVIRQNQLTRFDLAKLEPVSDFRFNRELGQQTFLNLP